MERIALLLFPLLFGHRNFFLTLEDPLRLTFSLIIIVLFYIEVLRFQKGTTFMSSLLFQ
jgi:hypothetical protein